MAAANAAPIPTPAPTYPSSFRHDIVLSPPTGFSSNPFGLSQSYDLNSHLRNTKLLDRLARVEKCIQQNQRTSGNKWMNQPEEMEEEEEKTGENVTETNTGVSTPTKEDTSIFPALHLSLIDLHGPSDTSQQPYRIRWQANQTVQFSMDENKIKISFDYPSQVELHHVMEQKSDSSRTSSSSSSSSGLQRFEFQVVLPQVQSKVFFIFGQRSMLRLQFKSPPNIYQLVSGPQIRSVPWISPLDPSDQRFAHLFAFQLTFNDTTTPKLLDFMKPFSRGIQIETSLPSASAQLPPDFSQWLGWSGHFDSKFESLSFSFRYLLHALVTTRKLVFQDSKLVTRLVETLQLYPQPRSMHELEKLLVDDSPVGGTNPHAELSKLLHQLTSSRTPVNASSVTSTFIAGPGATSSKQFLLRQLYVTPIRVLLNPPSYHSSFPNRILRIYGDYSDRFIRVNFVSETLNKISPNQTKFIKDRIHSIMKDGLIIGGIRFVFLACGNSQLRSHSAWFYCEERIDAFGEDEELFKKLPTAAQIRHSIGDVSGIALPSKQANRLGQAFSSTICQISISPISVCDLPDIVHDGYTFSDGIGVISQELASKIIQTLQLPTTTSAFQIRYQGAKGVVAVCSNSLSTKLLPNGAQLALRPSMIKFMGNPSHTDLEIISPAKPMPCYLNKQMIPILSSMGVPDQSFMDMLERRIKELKLAKTSQSHARQLLLQHARHKSAIIQLLDAGFDIAEHYLRQFVCSIIRKLLMEVQTRFRIPVPLGIRLMGIVDESLKVPDEFVFFQTKTMPMPVEGTRLIIGRDPSLHSGDIRLLKLCSTDAYPELAHLFDVLVFSARGNRPEANKMSGGDLDGDTFFIIWDPTISITNLKQHSPMAYDTIPMSSPVVPSSSTSIPVSAARPTPVDRDSFINVFTSYLMNASVGKIANSHAVWADLHDMGVLSPECLQLAQLHSDAVDFAKTNRPVTIPQCLNQKESPSWLGLPYKKPYESDKVLGKLFRQAKEVASLFLQCC